MERPLEGVSDPGARSVAVATLFWDRASGRVEYGVIGGTIMTIAAVFWIPAFSGLFALLKRRMPRYATCGLLIATYGCIGGAAFGLEGLFAEAFRLPHELRQEAWARFPIAFNLALFWPGSAFPLSLLALAAMLIRTRSIPMWTGLMLCCAALAFPLSRIPRIAALAHAADVLMLLPLAYIGWGLLNHPPQTLSRRSLSAE